MTCPPWYWWVSWDFVWGFLTVMVGSVIAWAVYESLAIVKWFTERRDRL